jgi:hypothetical protein
MRGVVVVLGMLLGCDRVYGLDGRDTRKCPETYTSVSPDGSSKYHVVGIVLTWPLAAAQCVVDQIPGSILHTHLAVLGDEQERMFVHSLLGGAETWIGLTSRRTSDEFVWVTDEDTGTYPPQVPNVGDGPPWALGEPNNTGGPACVAMDQPPTTDGEFFDRHCTNQAFAYICECDEYADDPAQY